MSDPHASSVDHDDHDGQHVASPILYFAIFGALLLGTGLTVLAAYHDFGPLNLPIAIAIGTVKATLVVLFFMHVKYAMPLVKLMVPMALAFWLVLIGLLACDYISRGWPT